MELQHQETEMIVSNEIEMASSEGVVCDLCSKERYEIVLRYEKFDINISSNSFFAGFSDHKNKKISKEDCIKNLSNNKFKIKIYNDYIKFIDLNNDIHIIIFYLSMYEEITVSIKIDNGRMIEYPVIGSL